jgi:hypothetical protein
MLLQQQVPFTDEDKQVARDNTPLIILPMHDAKFRRRTFGRLAIFKTTLAIALKYTGPEGIVNKGAFNIDRELTASEYGTYKDYILPGNTCMLMACMHFQIQQRHACK